LSLSIEPISQRVLSYKECIIRYPIEHQAYEILIQSSIGRICSTFGIELRMINVSKTSNHYESPNTQWERQIIIPPVHLLVWLY